MNLINSLLRHSIYLLFAAVALVPKLASAGAYLVPHFVEKSGTVNNSTYTFDTNLYFIYPGGQAGIPNNGGANVDLYLFDNSGNPLRSNTSLEVCNPCSYTLSISQRKVLVRIDDLIVARGGFGSGVVNGYALILVSGADPDLLHVSGNIINSKGNVLDLDISSLDIQKVSFINLIFADGFEFIT